jgi:signal transduction histidine kinase
MDSRNSISGQLQRGFIAIGLFGLATLILLGILDFEDVVSGTRNRIVPDRIRPEIIEHILMPAVFLLVPLFIATMWLLRRSFSSLTAAARRIDTATGMKRGFRVDLAGLPLEAVPFVAAVNRLLERLDDIAARQEAFAADAAHELRTPLAILALELERLPDPQADRLRADVAEMSRLVDHLLLIAQLDAESASPVPFEAVLLEDVVADVVFQTASIAIARNKTVEFEVEEDVSVLGRQEAIKAAVRNLVENGLRVTPAGGVVTVIVGPGQQIRVRDGGPGLSQDELSRLRKRFARADQAEPGGAGLGLAIVSRIIDIHGGQLRTAPEVREMQLVFPPVIVESAPSSELRRV